MKLSRWIINRFVKVLLKRHRGTSQLQGITEAMDLSMREEYGERWIRQNSESSRKIVFVDVGARGPLHPIARKFGNYISLTLFEPEASAAEVLRQQTAETSSINVLSVAVGARSESGTLFITRKPGGSSTRRFGGAMSTLIQRNHPDLSRFDTVATQQLKIAPLRDLVADIDILKIDTQGTSFEVLCGLGNLRPVLIELEAEYCEIYAGQKTIHEIGSLLTNLGYFLVENRIKSEPLRPNVSEYGLSVKVSGNIIFVPDLSDAGKHILRGRESQFQFACAAYGLTEYSAWWLRAFRTHG